MELSAKDVINILNKNFNHPIIHTDVGNVVSFNPYDAFVYSNVTGAGYLNHITFPFTPKGLMKIFYNAFDYNFVTGIFENLSFLYTPLYIAKQHPFLFDNEKYILPVEFKTESELYSKLENIESAIKNIGLRPEDFIIQRIEISKTGNGMEPFMEYLTCEYFKREGYVVENQVPLAHNVGSPDFAGYRTKEQLEFVVSSNKLNTGFHIIELSMIRLLLASINHNYKIPSLFNFIVGEAKTSSGIMADQLAKYMNTGLYTEGYEIHPNKTNPTYDSFGLINICANHIMRVEKPKVKYEASHPIYNKELYSKWLNNYFKFYLLANLTTDELNDFAFKQIGTSINSREDLVALVSCISYSAIYNQIIGV